MYDARKPDQSTPIQMMENTVKMRPDRLAILLLLLLACPLTAVAQSTDERHPWLTDDFTMSMGTFLTDKKVKISVNGSVPGEDIDFNEGAAVTSNDSTFSGVFRWRFGEKWSVAGQYWDSSDSSFVTLTEDIGWGDYTLKEGSNIGAGVELTVARVFFGRSFHTGARHEFGLGAGLHWLQFGAFIEGEFFINDESTGFRREAVSADAPLPNIGGWYWHAFSPRWMLTTRVDWLGVTVGEYSGSLWNANAGINFQAWRHVGLGLSYQYFALDVDIDKSDWNGGADLTYKGPFISLNVNW
jgi:hypothetical protein